MLPSTGLFKSYACPYFDGSAGSNGKNSGIGTCLRPYCHFKHVKKDEEPKSAQAASAVPVYTPAPKLLPLSLPTTIVQKKREKLEYQPEKPAFNASPTKKLSNELSKAPVYIPSTSRSNSLEQICASDVDVSDELNELNNIINEQLMEEAASLEQILVKEEKMDANAEQKTENPKSGDKVVTAKNNTEAILVHKSRHRSTSHSEDKRRERDKKEKEGDKHRERDKDKEKLRDNKKCKEREKEKHKEHERSKHKERHRDKDDKKDKSSSSSKGRSNSTSSSKTHSSSKHHTSSTSSRSTSRSDSKHSSTSKHQSTSKTSSARMSPSANTVLKNEKSEEKNSAENKISAQIDNAILDINNTDLFATTKDEIMKECEMIYEQLEQEFATLHKEEPSDAEMHQNSNHKRKHSEEDAASVIVARKRVAHENADKIKPPQLKQIQPKPNHTQNAIRSTFERQQRKQEEERAAAHAALREAEEKLQKAKEELEKTQSLTLLIPKNVLTPPPPRSARYFAPAANILALERAKKKVEELRAEKKPAFTLAKTSKGQRVAHTATAASVSATVTSDKTETRNAQVEAVKKPPVLEPHDTKISFNIRMQYYEMMVKHCQAIYPNIADAWERAQTEELAVFKKCRTPVIYKSSALLAINKLRKEAADSGNKPAPNKLMSHEVVLAGKLAHTTSWSVQKKMRTDATLGGTVEPFDRLAGDKAYEMVYELRLNEEQLLSNGFPQSGKRKGTAVIKSGGKATRRPNDTERYCCRCGKVFSLGIYDDVCVDECNYHPKSAGYRRGYSDNHHRCCQQPAGTPGCTYANYHVSDYYDENNLTGYVTTLDKDEGYVPTKKDIYALDCEMCYTTQGIELTRVTVVDINGRTVYDALVKPDNKIVDYNTNYSGITEQMLEKETRNIRDVQAILLSMFHSKTILVGHSLESDFKALKLIHGVVVDTSILFPHKMGPPKKRALKTLCVENLKRIIQENESGHDSAEDAEVCIQLVKFYLRNKIS